MDMVFELKDIFNYLKKHDDTKDITETLKKVEYDTAKQKLIFRNIDHSNSQDLIVVLRRMGMFVGPYSTYDMGTLCIDYPLVPTLDLVRVIIQRTINQNDQLDNTNIAWELLRKRVLLLSYGHTSAEVVGSTKDVLDIQLSIYLDGSIKAINPSKAYLFMETHRAEKYNLTKIINNILRMDPKTSVVFDMCGEITCDDDVVISHSHYKLADKKKEGDAYEVCIRFNDIKQYYEDVIIGIIKKLSPNIFTLHKLEKDKNDIVNGLSFLYNIYPAINPNTHDILKKYITENNELPDESIFNLFREGIIVTNTQCDNNGDVLVVSVLGECEEVDYVFCKRKSVLAYSMILFDE